MDKDTFSLLIVLTFGHILGDFLFQTTKDVQNKHRFGVLLKHAATVGFLSYVTTGLPQCWPIMIAVAVAHFFIDLGKVFAKKSWQDHELSLFFIDQAAHLLSILLISWALLSYFPCICSGGWWSEKTGLLYLKLMIIIGGFILSVRAGAMVMEMAVRPFLSQLKIDDLNLRKGLENGGRFIGQLERALIYLFVLAGQPNAIGFLIAAKSILRFGEIKDGTNRMEAEYIIIGTLMSFFLGLVVAFGAQRLLELLK